MNQPDPPVPARSARPQMFGASGSSKVRQPDFGPSILATIDGSTALRRSAKPRDGAPLKRVLWMSAFALAVVVLYFGVKLGVMPSASPNLGAALPAPVVIAKATEELNPAPASAVPSTGVASIETVTVPPAPAASAPAAAKPGPDVAGSLNNIQQVLARADAVDTSKAPRQPAPPKEAVKQAPVHPVASTAKPAAKAGADSDAELLAAMLPHLKRRAVAPTSPAYEKRCGALRGDEAVDCRAKFCSGREGNNDAACPVAPAP